MTRAKEREYTIRGYVVFCVLVIVVVIGGVGLISLSSRDAASSVRDSIGQAQEAKQMIANQSNAQDVGQAEIPEALAQAKAANPDVCAWLYFPNTTVSLPILQSLEDDRKYVDESADGSNEVLGATFIEKANSPYFIDPVTIVYGHAFDDEPDVMLGQLHKFEDKSFFDANDTFYIYLENKVLEYRIACTCPYHGIHILSFIDMGFDDGTLQRYMTYALDPGVDSRFVRDVGQVDASYDRIVQISTCTFPASAEYRYVVTGVLVDERAIEKAEA